MNYSFRSKAVVVVVVVLTVLLATLLYENVLFAELSNY